MKSQIPLHQCRLYKCTSKRRLAEYLQISTSDLKSIPEWATYRTWSEEKPHGGTRTIYAPSDKLKSVQRRIKHLLERIEKPSWVYSGVKGRCHVDNALAHRGSSYFVLSDIASFYEHCTRESVYQFFLKTMKVAPDVAKILADITTCENREGQSIIPVGSPCSQLLAFFAYREMFDEFQTCAETYGCRISLYVDDIMVSSRNPISNPKSMMKRFARIASAYGHSLKWTKTHYYGTDKFKVVTGVALDGRGDPFIPNALGKNIKEGFERVLDGDIKWLIRLDTKPSVEGESAASYAASCAAIPE